MISPELIAEALEKYQNMDMETESEPTEECDFSVFDTITSLMGKDITRSIQQRNQSPPDRKETILNNNSHGDAESCQPQLTSPNLRQTQNEVSKEGLGTEGAGSMLETFQPPLPPSLHHPFAHLLNIKFCRFNGFFDHSVVHLFAWLIGDRLVVNSRCV